MTARRDWACTTTPWQHQRTSEPLGAREGLFYVVGEHKGQTAYYSGWWHTYGEALLTHHPDLGAKAMTRSNANRVRRRLENPEIWGGEWRLVPCK